MNRVHIPNFVTISMFRYHSYSSNNNNVLMVFLPEPESIITSIPASAITITIIRQIRHQMFHHYWHYRYHHHRRVLTSSKIPIADAMAVVVMATTTTTVPAIPLLPRPSQEPYGIESRRVQMMHLQCTVVRLVPTLVVVVVAVVPYCHYTMPIQRAINIVRRQCRWDPIVISFMAFYSAQWWVVVCYYGFGSPRCRTSKS